jgi:sugar transferase (PEP-CTERM/EpsH1 system associated)
MSAKPKLLFITSRVPWPLEKGDKLRAYYQLRELSQRFEITLASIHDSPIHPEAEAQLKKYCSEVHFYSMNRGEMLQNMMRGVFTKLPMQVAYFYSKKVQQDIDQLIERIQPDRIYCQLIRTAEYVRKHTNYVRIIDFMDVFSKGMDRRLEKVNILKKPAFYLEMNRVARYEAAIFKEFDRHTIISEQDRDLMPVRRPSEIAVFPNGVDIKFFHPLHRHKEFDLLFNGNMNYPPNVEGAEFLVKKVLPLVLAKYPGIKVLISGSNPSSKVRSLASGNVVITGWVDDIRESFARSRILVAPMRSSIGLQNKLLEGMAMHIPCVTTALSNNALRARPGKEIMVADSPEEFAAAIIKLISHPELAVSIADDAWDFVRDYYSWEPICERLANFIEADVKKSLHEKTEEE